MPSAAILPVDHPGTFIEEELEARGWSQADLAYVLGKDGAQVSKLINGKSHISSEIAVELADAFNVSPEFFMNLQNSYDLHRAKKADPGVKSRAAWVSHFPVREMIKRGWIEDAEPSLLDLQMVRFFGKDRVEDVPFVSDTPVISHAAKKSAYDTVTGTQYAWLHRVIRIGQQVKAPPYSRDHLAQAIGAIRAHMLDKEDLRHIPSILLRAGVRLVIVEALPGSKIDGVCVWLDDQPVIGLSLRQDRMDNFCFVLRHECEHVLRGDGRTVSFAPVDEALTSGDLGGDVEECERIANEAAADFCVSRKLLDSFIARKSPFISEKDVLSFAARMEINPSVVVGQIQYRTKKYEWLRKYLSSVRPYLLGWGYVDGWGKAPPTGL